MREARRKSQGLWLVGVPSELKATLGCIASLSQKTKMKKQNRIEKETKKEITNVLIFKPM